jgi:hypothetical protein
MREQVRQQCRLAHQRVYSGRDVPSTNTIAVSIGVRGQGERISDRRQRQRHVCRSRNGLGTSEREPTREIARRSERAASFDPGCELRNRGGNRKSNRAGDKQQLDERVAVGRMAPRGPRAARRAPATRRVRYCPDFGSVTVMSGFIFKKLFSPTPLTFIRSSTFLKPPFFCR